MCQQMLIRFSILMQSCMQLVMFQPTRFTWQKTIAEGITIIHLAGGFNPFEKYQSKWESSPSRG